MSPGQKGHITGQMGRVPGTDGWYSAKWAGVKRACPNKDMAHIWFIHDAYLGPAFLFLDILAEYTFLSLTVMVTPCLWYVVGMKLVCPMSKFPQAPFARAPFGECRDGTHTRGCPAKILYVYWFFFFPHKEPQGRMPTLQDLSFRILTQRIAKGAGKKVPRENCRKVSKSFLTLFDDF